MTSPPAVEADRLGFAYAPGRWLFRDLSFALGAGESLAILGPNGVGKTTLLRLLLRTLKPTEGGLRVAGRCAFVPQIFEVAFDFSTLDMVLMGRARRIGVFGTPGRRDREAALHALERMGLVDKADAPFQTLSGGQRQLALIARALVAEADILVLDEPTSALDLRNQELVLEWLHRLSRLRGLTVVFTTHEPSRALVASDKALLMFSDATPAYGDSAEILTEAALRQLYGVTLAKVSFDLDGRRVESFAPVHRRGAGSEQRLAD